MKMFASPTDNAFNDFLANYGFYFALALANMYKSLVDIFLF